MNKNRNIAIVALLLEPLQVLAKTGSSEITFNYAIFMEAFVTIHMSMFVLKPLSVILGKENDKNLFWIMFLFRIVILLFFDLFVTPSIAFIDFILVFIGAFIVVPICALLNKDALKEKFSQMAIEQHFSTSDNTSTSNETILKCGKCGNTLKETDKFCTNCGEELTKTNVIAITVPSKISVSPNNFDSIYQLSEDQMLEEFINRQLSQAKIDKNNNLMPSDILKKKKVLNAIFAILVFVYTSAIFFHFPIYTYLIGLIILFIFYKSARKYDLMKYIKKQVKERPSEKVSNILMNVKSTLTINNSKRTFAISTILAILIPLLIFINPRIMYEKLDNGYGVRFYTFGLTNFTSATIPASYKNENVVSLRGNTFSNMFFLKEVLLPNTITEIRGQTFKNDYQLVEVNIPNNLEYLGGGAFYNCKSITSIALPDTVTFIGGESFYNAKSLENIKLPNNITEIRGNSFENCTSLKSITIPDSVNRIGGHAFYGCSSLNEVNISKYSQLAEIGSSAFRMCDSLYNITLPAHTYVNERAFKESPTTIKRFDYWDYNYNY